MTGHIDQLRMLLPLIDPRHITKADYTALLALASAALNYRTSGGASNARTVPESGLGESVA